MRTLAALLLVLVLASACESRESREAQLVLNVRDDVGRPLSGVSVRVDGTRVGSTDRRGEVRAIIRAQEKARVLLGVDCAEGYRPLEPRDVPLQRGRASPLAFELVCRPSTRKLAVVVRAPGAEGLTVRADGAPLGTVGADGTLHALVMRPPDADLRLSIDTSSVPELIPQNPAQLIRVPDRDELILFDQALVRAPTARRPKAVRRATSALELPYAIRSER
jgi:hypothetical protein